MLKQQRLPLFISNLIPFRTGEVSLRRLKLWAESFEELLQDEAGRDTLEKFLDKEYSGENLRFWWKVAFFVPLIL